MPANTQGKFSMMARNARYIEVSWDPITNNSRKSCRLNSVIKRELILTVLVFEKEVLVQQTKRAERHNL